MQLFYHRHGGTKREGQSSNPGIKFLTAVKGCTRIDKTEMKIHFGILWVIILCSLVGMNQSLEETYYPHVVP
jgi:hypothetical protein